MRKTLLLATFLFPALAHADSTTDYPVNTAQLAIDTMIVLIFYFASKFILSLIKMKLDARFRDKLIDSDRSDETIRQLLMPAERERKNEAFRTMAILGGVSTGLVLVYATQPFGFHSLAIMTFCLALSFLGYYFYLQRIPANPNQSEEAKRPDEQL